MLSTVIKDQSKIKKDWSKAYLADPQTAHPEDCEQENLSQKKKRMVIKTLKVPRFSEGSCLDV